MTPLPSAAPDSWASASVVTCTLQCFDQHLMEFEAVTYPAAVGATPDRILDASVTQPQEKFGMLFPLRMTLKMVHAVSPVLFLGGDPPTPSASRSLVSL